MHRLRLQVSGQSDQARPRVDRMGYGLRLVLVLISALLVYVSHIGAVEEKASAVDEVRLLGLDERPFSPACVAPERTRQPISTNVVLPFPNLSFENPTDMVQAPHDDETWYLAERRGLIYRFANDEAVVDADIVLDIQDRIQFTRFDDVQRDSQQWGIMNFEFHPQFPTVPYLYVAYNAKESPDAITRAIVARFETADGGQTFNPASEMMILTQPYARPFHHLGNIEFGPDGYLYIGLGDGNIRRSGEGQDLNELLGAILRIDIDSATPYAIPPDNPLVGTGLGREELYAWGFRNPWRFSFDRESGTLWMGDVGGSQWEEVNIVQKGGNYGWNLFEGNQCKSAVCDTTGLIPPTHTYDHSEGSAAMGGYVYRGSAIPGLVGTYVFGDVSTTRIWGLFFDSNGESRRETVAVARGGLLPPHLFAEGNDGELYFMRARTMQTPRKIVPGDTPQLANTEFPQRLSETGCVDPADPKRPAVGTIPYHVNSPLWSDGAVKQRWMSIPEEAQIVAEVDGDFDFPVGTVLVKSFAFDDTPVETRLLIRHSDGGWAGYSYEWLDDSSDAVLLETGKTKVLPNGLTWTFPSGTQCLICHTSAAGFALGPELAQLNSTFEYPSTGRTANQLDTLKEIGVLVDPRERSSDQLPALAAASDSDRSTEDRARGYLHANCSGCHRPGGPTQALVDFRFFVSNADMNVCNVTPELGNLNIEHAALLVSGSADRSILYQRMSRRDEYQMPPLGTSIVDMDALQVLQTWILNDQPCPVVEPPHASEPPEVPTTPMCFGQVATIVGTPGDDVINGTNRDDVIVALGGNDIVKGRGGNDLICGGEGDDDLRGGPGNDTISGGAGNDLIAGKQDNDLLMGDQGDDTLLGDRGDDILEGNEGSDYCHGGPHDFGDESDISCEGIRATP